MGVHCPGMKDISRRKVLLGTAGLTTATFAGCVSGNDDSGNNTDDGGTDDGATGIRERSISHTGSDCAGREPDTATVVVDGATYTVEGSLPSPTPCYEPELVETGYTDGTLSLTVDIVDDGSESCMECEGQVNYDATVELAEDTTVETVSVSHESGETHTVEQSAFLQGYPEVLSSSIETTGADSRDGTQTGDTDLETSGETVTVTGRILTETPHYEAVLEEIGIERRKLQLTIGTKSTLDDDEVGTQVLGFIEYEATIEIDDVDNLTGATVHLPNGSAGFGWEGDSASASGSRSESSSTSDRADQ